MKFLFLGIVLGGLLAFIPYSEIDNGARVTPEWFGSVEKIRSIDPSNNINKTKGYFLYPSLDHAYLLNADGSFHKEYSGDENSRFAFSGDKEYYIQFEKVGSHISFLNRTGAKFWITETPQYPYLSHSAKLVLLLVSDLHTIFLNDKNGKPVGIQKIEGRMCTNISFSKNDYAIAGFMSSEYYIVDSSGNLVLHGKTPEGTIVKSCVLSDNSSYAAIHYGTVNEDGCMIINISNIPDGDFELSVKMESVHKTRTGIAISDTGTLHLLDGLYYRMFDNKGNPLFAKEIEPQSHGHAQISLYNGLAIASYRLFGGKSILSIYDNDLNILHSETFEDTALNIEITGDVLFAAGTKNLSAYSLAR
ncbi:MAG TPA: hypothetical protein P5123_00805 [Spirochaetota bacterium]|nr:hypothetical protein [Spirochaetota bacterium]